MVSRHTGLALDYRAPGQETCGGVGAHNGWSSVGEVEGLEPELLSTQNRFVMCDNILKLREMRWVLSVAVLR